LAAFAMVSPAGIIGSFSPIFVSDHDFLRNPTPG